MGDWPLGGDGREDERRRCASVGANFEKKGWPRSEPPALACRVSNVSYGLTARL
jgi:hypothetical protein